MNSAVRSHIIRFMQEELVGPASPLTLHGYVEGFDIPFREKPRSRYGAGILFPQKAYVTVQEEVVPDETDDVGGEQNAPEDDAAQSGSDRPSQPDLTDQAPENDYEITLANEYLPSAMGITAMVDASDNLQMQVAGAYYKADKAADSSGGVNRSWRRFPFAVTMDIPGQKLLEPKPYQQMIPTGEDVSGIKIHVYSRPSPLEGDPSTRRIVTFTLINTRETARSNPRDEDCYFQCSFSVTGKDDRRAFLEYPESYFKQSLTEEEEELALLYRHRKVFAVGHGCSADWNAVDGDDACSRIEARVIPEYEVRPVLPTQISGLSLDMWSMGTGNREEAVRVCSTLTEKYEHWINEKHAEIADLPQKHQRAATRHLERCRACLGRIREGIEILKTDDSAYAAFSLMNKAMKMQYIHYNLSTDAQKIRTWKNLKTLSGKYTAPDYEASPARHWRPFQLAFILMSLRSIVDETCDDRDCVDLIWFPTGGGKTEAYLGLAAFTIFFRRLTSPGNAGTTAIMRYTLRLLTTQQFQRAASLICAMEKLRRDDPRSLGNDLITIGLWVGAGVTPNKEDSARNALNELKNRGKNVFVLTSCPWCGAQMGRIEHGNQNSIKGYRKLRGPDRVRHVCEDLDCEFSKLDAGRGYEGLPVQIIDEHIYANPPTLLIGTVDKFAIMPWTPNARKIFGIDTGRDCDPPWLIIQDEMHLISGPLGSMVGHYETVVDALCERMVDGKPIRPKVVASTATISNAPDQIEKLFGRKKHVLFPPQGLKAGDSFFAEEKQDANGRKYVGIFATGMPSQMTTMVRVMAALIQAPVTGDYEKSAIDPYWTQMVYFNSIRELGHAVTLIRSDVPEYLSVLSNIRLQTPKDSPKRRSYIRRDEELTSRIPSDRVKDILDSLFIKHHENADEAIDVCLATNMIQVGLDVPRLSLMVIAGQPKTTSEYIQASSRVGRDSDSPGLVFTVLNPGKPRDRSHYEHFRAYHQCFYKYVEPTSVTPFSVPVRERALHALIITLIRYWGGSDIREAPDAVIPQALKERIGRVLKERIELIDPGELDASLEQIDYIWEKWSRLNPSKYGHMWGGDSDQTVLMITSEHNQFEDLHRISFPTPTSMRNVDASCEAGIVPEYEES